MTEPADNEHKGIKRIREELRELKICERKNLREMLFERTRFALGECGNANFGPDDITGLAKELKKKSLNIKKYRDLQNALLQSEENINAFLSVDHAIHSLARDLSGNHPQIQLIAASCCCNISLGNAKACLAVAKNCVPYLVTELDSMSYHLVEVCAWTVGNLAIGNQKCVEILIAQDCIKHLIKLINHCDNVVRAAVTYALVRCLFVGHHVIPKNEVIDMAKEMAKNLKDIEEFEDLWFLALLSSNSDCFEFLLPCAAATIENLNNKLADENHNVVEITALIRLLGNLASESSGQVAELLLNNSSFTVESLPSRLLMHSYIHIRKETLWLLGNIYNHPKPEIRHGIAEVVKRLTNFVHAINSVQLMES